MICRHLPIQPRIPRQIDTINRWVSPIDELLETACRGGGKTENGVIGTFIIAAGEPGTPVSWLAGDRGQLDEAYENIRKFAPFFNAHLGHFDLSRRVRIDFDNGSFIDLNPLTVTSGPRRFTIVKDEGGKVLTPALKREYVMADGMMEGTWEYPRRLRHITTLCYDSAIEPVFYRLKSIGRVYSFPERECPWVHNRLIRKYGIGYRMAIEDQYGRSYFNTEYDCEMDAANKGTRIFNKIKIVNELPTFNQSSVCLIGIDTNIGQGNAAVVGIQHLGKIYMVDEYFGVALRTPVQPDDPVITDKSGVGLADWLKAWQRRFPGRCAIVCETQGVSVKNSLEKLGVTGITPEAWSGPIQIARIPMTVDLCSNESIVFTKNVPILLKQINKAYRQENGVIPKQDDHCVDAMHHMVMARSVGVSDVYSYQPEAWV